MARVNIGEDHDWANTAIARRRAVANSVRSAEVQERKAANRVSDHRAKRRQQAENRRLVPSAAVFSPEAIDRLKTSILRTAEATRGETADLDAARRILSLPLDTGETDRVAVLPTADQARLLVRVLRTPGVGGLHYDTLQALERLEAIAETPLPTTPGFNTSITTLTAVLKLVEADEHHVPTRERWGRFNRPKVTAGTIYSTVSQVKDPKRFEAAAILRRVVIRCASPKLHLSPQEAILLSDVLTALKADRLFLSHVNRIAELAPAAAG